jgi:hypothetical protein
MEKVKKLEHCPICQKFGTDTGFSFWCTNEKCQNYKSTWNNSSEYNKECDCGDDCPGKEDCPDKGNCPKVSSKRSGGTMFNKQLIDALEDVWEAML